MDSCPSLATIPAREQQSPSKRSLVLVVLGSALMAACTSTRPSSIVRPQEPIDPILASRFDVPAVEVIVAEPPRTDGELRVHSGTLRIDGVELSYRYYASVHTEKPAPFLLVLPILAGGKPITDRVCRSLAHRGFAAGTLERRWRLFRENETIEELEGKMVTAVRQARGFLAWVAARDDIDSSRLGCFGISMGGMLATMLAAVEPRIDCAVICLSGGDFPRLMLEAEEIQVERWVERRCAAEEITPLELQERARTLFRADPLAFAPAVDSSRVLYVTARFDGVIPRACREALWRALGKPHRIDVPLGHYSSILALEWIVARSARFALERLDVGS